MGSSNWMVSIYTCLCLVFDEMGLMCVFNSSKLPTSAQRADGTADASASAAGTAATVWLCFWVKLGSLMGLVDQFVLASDENIGGL